MGSGWQPFWWRAGASRRMGFDKLSYAFDGKTVLQHSVQALAGHR